jgi:uroporphyrinogen decarboxylase
MIRAMLQGVPPSRPLLLPIVFSLGTRLENLSLRAFLANPTRIASALRQIRTVLALDGVCCYFDPYLEAEALGCEVKWNADDSSRVLRPFEADVASLRGRLRSPQELAERGRVPVACEVVRRLKAMLPGEPALVTVATGPYALAAQLTGDSSGEAVEFTSEITAALCKSFLDAGANVIFLRETTTAITDYQQWAELLCPIVNVIRFYEALPVLLPRDGISEAAMAALNAGCEGLVCPGVIDLTSGTVLPQVTASSAGLSLLTTQDDISADTDLKRLTSLFGSLGGGSRATD